MGIVYLAKDPLIGRLVALKTIRPAAHADDEETREFQQRFIREAQAAGILNHPAIVTVFDIGQDEATQTNFIAMEYVEGHNLKEVLSQGRPLTFDQIGEIVAQIADALDFAHAKGIVHRDVKPANLILLEGNRAKIMDFGIAKIASGVANLTSTGQFLGTPNYMAPEQIKGVQVDGRTDIFSLGICLYEMLTRRKPFGGDSLTSISYKIVHEPFPPLQEINPQIPEGYEEVVGHALAKDPARRFQRGKDFADAIRAVIRGEKPIRHEPLLADETIITRDRDKIPTVEIPFPDAAETDTTPVPAKTKLSTPAAAAAAAAGAPVVVASLSPKPKIPLAEQVKPIARRVHRTLTDVRSAPLWRQRLHPAIFASALVVVLAIFGSIVISLRNKQLTIPKVDAAAEVRTARERALRVRGNQLLREGKLTEAYNTFVELAQVAPRSPAVTAILDRLSTIRQREEVGKQQVVLAKQKFDQGLALYNEKKYAAAIPLLQESFSLNPNSDDTVNYLKLAQQEEQKIQQAKQKSTKSASTKIATGPRTTTGTQSPAGGDGGPTVPVTPSRLTTVFNSPFSDGYIMVKAGADVVAHENLWEEKGRMFRRKTPRPINVTRDVTPKNADLEIWVVVPSQKIQEHHVIRQNFAPGSSHRLLVTFNAQSKKFDYQLN